MVPLVLFLLALAFLPMALEARLAARHDRALRSAGASEPKDDVFPWMQLAYPAAFLAMAFEAWGRRAHPNAVFMAGAVVFALAKAIKYWAIATLGDRWTFRVLVPPASSRITSGPYRFMRHPNYLGVLGEIAGMALMAQAPIAGPLWIVIFGILILARIRVEERALAATSDQRKGIREKGKGIREKEFVTASKPSEVATVLLGLCAVTLTVLHQQAGDLYAVPDRGDPLFSMWRIAWVQHQLANDPRHLFDANIFYPLPATLTYSDSMVLPAVAATPLAWAGVHPVVAYNLVLLAALILSGFSAYLLVRAMGCGRASAWIAAVSFTLCPFRINHLSHLELQMTMWMPVVLLAVHRILREGQGHYVLVLGLALAAQWYSSMYYGLFLALYAAVFGAVLAGAWRASARHIFYVAAGACLAVILVWPLARVYIASAPARGVRPAESVAEFSAVPSDYLRPGVGSPTYRALLPRVVHAERALFPGVVPLALAAAGAWPPLTATRTAFIVAGGVAFDGSLGVHGVLYPLLYKFAWPFQSIRVPARFGILVGLTIAVLAGAGAGRVLARVPGPRARIATVALFTFALMADGWARYDRLPMWRHPPGIYASIPRTGAVLFEFPIHPQPERFAENLPYMYFSIWHWTPMVNGYSGFNPRSYTALLEGTSAFPDPRSLDYLGRTGVTHIAVHCRLWEPEVCAATVHRLETMPQVRRIASADWYGAPSSLYELRK